MEHAVQTTGATSDLLTEISDIADSLLPIDHTGHCVATPVGGFNNGCPFVKGDVAKAKRNAVLFKDTPHGNAERRPLKLNEREHGVYMPEAEESFNIGGKLEMNRRSASVIAWQTFVSKELGIR